MRLFRLRTQEIVDILDAAEHTLDFYFPSTLPGGAENTDQPDKRFSNGNVSINFKTTKGTGANSTGLTVACRAIVRYDDTAGASGANVAASNDIQTVVTALDWTTAKCYSYPVTQPFGPCQGIQVGFTYANGAAGEKMTIEAWLETE